MVGGGLGGKGWEERQERGKEFEFGFKNHNVDVNYRTAIVGAF